MHAHTCAHMLHILPSSPPQQKLAKNLVTNQEVAFSSQGRGHYPHAVKDELNSGKLKVIQVMVFACQAKGKQTETLPIGKKGNKGESRTPDSRERTQNMMVIREGGGIGQESYTLTSPDRAENWTACFE